MAPNEPGEPTEQERERIEERVMAEHRAVDQRATSSALRRLPLVLITMLLLGLLFRWLAS